jgi:CDP-diacylglycerol---glycerol-3-phosphate 3-phosphatidyltransferase
MNFPNTLSILRILLSPVFAWLFLSGSVTLIQISFFVFTAAALTDWYDGWYARKYGFKTRWGQFLDPLADKILTSSALVCFYFLNIDEPRFFGTNEFIPVGILVAVIVTRDIALTAVRSYKELKGQEFRTSFISKTKTFIQMTYIFAVIGFITIGVTFGGTAISTAVFDFLYSDFNYYVLVLITLLTVLSGIAYIFETRAGTESAHA